MMCCVAKGTKMMNKNEDMKRVMECKRKCADIKDLFRIISKLIPC